MTVMRCALKAEDSTFKLMLEHGKSGDDFGVGRVIAALHRLAVR